jgi:phospholysine phosphohistidine inorganic pyrophosphate phosphatase
MEFSMRGILFDLDGVLYNSEEPIEGAAETLDWVTAKGIPHLFVTNTTSRGRSALVEKLARFGIQAGRNQILTPCSAAAEWLRTRKDGSVALFVTRKALEEFEGLQCLPPDAEEGADYVVIGDLGDAWDFRTLNRAFRLLHADSRTALLALGLTPYWQAQDGPRLDVAPFVAALECATGHKALVFGKPAESFYHTAAKQLNLPSDQVAMVGDGIETDVAGAQKAGLKGVLVRTGKFRPADLEGTIRPDAVLNSIRALPDWWAKESFQRELRQTSNLKNQ